MSAEKQVPLFFCHRTEPEYVQRFLMLERAFRPFGDTFFLFDNAADALPASISKVRHFPFSLKSLQTLGYSWRHGKLIPGDGHFPVHSFFMAHPHYSHYWVIEYDVYLFGPWRLFFHLHLSLAQTLPSRSSWHAHCPLQGSA